MKNKQIIIALSVFLVLVIVYFVAIKTPEKSSVVGGYQPLCRDFTSSKIKKIELYRGNNYQDAIVLKRNKDSWIVESSFHVPGDAEKIQKLLLAISAAEGKVRATGKDFFEDFDLTEKKALHIVLTNEGTSYHILIGKKGADYQGSFVRLADDDDILLTDKDIRNEIGIWGESPLRSEDWINHRFLQLDKDRIQKITYRLNGKDFLFVKKEGKIEEKEATEGSEHTKKKEKTYEWELTPADGVFEIKESKVGDILSAAASLIIEKAVDPEEYSDDIFKSTDTSVHIAMEGGVTHTIYFAYKDGNSYVKKDGYPGVYKIASYEKKRLAPDAGEFLEINLPEIEELAGYQVLDYHFDPEWSKKQASYKELKADGKRVKVAYALVSGKTWICFDNDDIIFVFDKDLFETLNKEEGKEAKG